MQSVFYPDNFMKDTLKERLPSPLLDTAREARDLLARAAEWPSATFHPRRRESIRRLAELKDIHRGERCVIIGNGPSLKNTDIRKLRSEYTFGMNRVYLAFEEWGFTTSYLVSVNSLVIEQCAADFLAQPIPVFLSWRSRKSVPGAGFQVPANSNAPVLSPSHAAAMETATNAGTRHLEPGTQFPVPGSRNPEPVFLHTTYTGPRFSTDARGRLWEGATVTFVCLQLDFHMGFETAVLIGVDHSFKTTGAPNTTVTSQGEDVDHFNPGYFGKGFRWQLPDLDTSEVGYWMAKKAYEEAGRQVLDATVGGKLQVFEKADFRELFDNPHDSL